jgi:hypothetical protein
MAVTPTAQTVILQLARKAHPVQARPAIPEVPAIPVSFPHY